MYGYIDGYDFGEMEAMKYYAPPSTWSDEKKRETAKQKIFSGDWLGAEKKDGYFAKLVKDEDGTIILYSRSRGVNGKFADKHEWLPHLEDFFELLPNGTCLLGELYLPKQPGSKNVTSIMGCLKEKAIARQEKGEKLHFYIFDILAWGGISELNSPFETRVRSLNFLRSQLVHKYVGVAEYKAGKELWIMLQEVLANGGEGVVISHRGGNYEPGKRPSKTTLKIKKELQHTIDCFFTGVSSLPTHIYNGKEIENWQYWENQRTGEKVVGNYYKEYSLGAGIVPVTKGWYYGWAGSLEIGVLKDKPGFQININGQVYKDKEIYPLGWLSGLPDEMKADPKKYAYQPIEVTAMEMDLFTFALRHGKMKGWRKDLTVEDCTYEKIEG